MVEIIKEVKILLLILPLTVLLLAFLSIYIKICRSVSYRKASGNSLFSVWFDKGTAGEYLLYRKLCKVPGHKAILSNVYICRPNGETTETDMVLIHTSGIYVFEMKNYKGAVFGSGSALQWTQTFGKNKKNRFYNPVKQNQIHINAIKTALEFENYVYFHSFIIFSDSCKLNVKELPEDVCIICLNGVLKEINKVIGKFDGILSLKRADEIFTQLNVHNIRSDEIKQRHIQNTKRNTNFQ